MVVAPHCDDETLGCGGTLLRHAADGDHVHWVIVTSACPESGYSAEETAAERALVTSVALAFNFKSTHCLNLKPSFLDNIPLSNVIAALRKVIDQVRPEIIYLPHGGDVHSDHGIVARAVVSSAKWFRNRSVRRMLAYETLSETEFGIAHGDGRFAPNVFVDITPFLDKKIEIFAKYKSEVGAFPFPRSEEALRALAALRGSTSGVAAAEAFTLLKETV
jgi:LmbE family N-acetylglucosaminyl deacetylase